MKGAGSALSRWQQLSLVALRTLIGWHFLYEGYFKLWRPAWSRDGAPLPPWTSSGYLRAASGPLADIFHRLGDSPWLKVIDAAVVAALLMVGFSLMLGLFTQAGCMGALVLLGLFYLSAIPTTGAPQPGSEGTYLFVNKNLVEACAVLVLLAFGTGRLAGLDCLRRERGASAGRVEELSS